MLIFSVIDEITADIRTLNNLCTKSKRKHLKKKNKLLHNVVRDFCDAKQLSHHMRDLECISVFIDFQNADSLVYCFRLIGLFMEIIGFSIALLFLWTFASVCSGLLTLEFGFVEYPTAHCLLIFPNVS